MDKDEAIFVFFLHVLARNFLFFKIWIASDAIKINDLVLSNFFYWGEGENEVKKKKEHN